MRTLFYVYLGHFATDCVLNIVVYVETAKQFSDYDNFTR